MYDACTECFEPLKREKKDVMRMIYLSICGSGIFAISLLLS